MDQEMDFTTELPDKTVVMSSDSGIADSVPASDTHGEIVCGQVLGEYRILKPLSEGGMGKIFLCYPLSDPSLRLVMKVLKNDSSVNPLMKKRFKREYELSANLHHECIVQTIASWFDENSEYIVMEYVDGLTLAQMVSLKYVFTQEYSIYMMQMLAKAFNYAWNSLKLLHRDIKPSNIMISNDGEIKILDFGIAKSLLKTDTVLTVAGKSLGSPGFMSPEQFRAPQSIDCTSDIFSLGATVYYVLTGEMPFPGKNMLEIYNEMLSSKPIPLCEANPEISQEFSDLVMNTLDIEPSRRPFCWSKLIASLDRVANGGKPII